MTKHGLRLILYAALVGALAAAAYLTLRGFDLLGATSEAQVKSVPSGHQEVAFLMPATSGETWERLVAAVDALRRDWAARDPKRPQLEVSKTNAFVELTADVAELALWLKGGEDQKLWIRWYKLTSENTPVRWVEKLSQRSPPPLAVIGGDISDRALTLALTLKAQEGKWQGRAPLFLMTTATADRYSPHASPNQDHSEDLPRLIHIYTQRTFRFSFTNKHMARVVLNFVRDHPELWTSGPRQLAAPAGAAASANAWAALVVLGAAEQARPHVLHTMSWDDDSYSLDLATRFRLVFPKAFPQGRSEENHIAYSTGDYFLPNPREAIAVNLFLNFSSGAEEERRLLALPTSTQRAHRLLRTLVRRDPLQARNLVVITGDSIGFNSIYRDRNVAWNVLDVPVPLVLFAHRNPIKTGVGFRPAPDGDDDAGCSSTDDLLLHLDVMEALIQAAYQDRRLLADANALRDRLRATAWVKGRVEQPGFEGTPAGQGVPLFDSDGDRSPHTGEHIIWLNPSAGGGLLNDPVITVWRQAPVGAEGSPWRAVGEPLHVRYNWAGAP
jgi:hypothetical protein